MLAGMQTQFHGKAQAYDKARPGYPQAAMQYIASLMPRDATVADIGAGTGKFTIPLVRLGYTVYAVEPDADMRGVLTDATRDIAHVTVFDGSAAHTGLPDNSVDVVTCAQALHWFDHDAFLAECARIARSNTFLLVSIYNSTSFDSAMMLTSRDNKTQTAAVPPDDASDIGISARHFRETTAAFFTHPEIRRFVNPIHYTRDAWRTYMDSHSHSPLPSDPAYMSHRAWVDAIFDARAVGDIMTDDNVTMVASQRIHVA